jgi:cytochrome c2
VPSETIYGYVEPERIPFGVVSARIFTKSQFFTPFAPKMNATDPEVVKGERIAMGSCISCHNIGNAGGTVAMRPWTILAIYAATNSDHFRNYVVNPQKINPTSKMTPHPTFDAKTLDALQAYFKTMAPQ